MTIKLTANKNNPPIGGIAAAYLIQDLEPVEIVWGSETTVSQPNHDVLRCNTNNDVLRAMARAAPAKSLYGQSALERTQVDYWLTYTLTWQTKDKTTMEYLDESIAPVTFLCGNKLTIADLALYNEMYWRYDELLANGRYPQVKRWYELIHQQTEIQEAIKSLPADAQRIEGSNLHNSEAASPTTTTGERKQEGKFVELPGAEMGKVVVRFPPEASGFLHIGHAKAALLNQYYAQAFEGKLIMRFDDTNPAKETVEFEDVILEDLELLKIKPDIFTYTSNYFDLMLSYCEQLINEGKAYVDDTPPEQMKSEREQRTESKNRSNSVEKNMQMWQEMLVGSESGQKCCVRAKIDMSSPNGCLRDPTIYRCKNEPHPRTGTKYKVYPTYDFACPIVDAIENVTHTLRTMEYHDRDDQFYWFIDALKLRKPYIWEYSRLNMTNTVLSKRKLTWFVEEGLVDGWDDPRFPTVRGVLRRGMTVEGLREFIIAQGSSKSVVFMNWDKIWAFNKKVIDPIAPRYTALEHENRVIVNVEGAKYDKIDVPLHPKNENVGKKSLTLGPRIYIDYEDAVALKEGENATFINWGNLLIKKVHKDNNGRVTSIDAGLNLDNKDFKKTLKLTWLAVEEHEDAYPPCWCVYFDNIINKPVLGKDEDFKSFIGHKTRKEVKMLADPELKNVKKGDIIQLQRRGFFKVDNAYAPRSPFSSVCSPVILFSIPDGHTKNMPSSGLQINSVQENNKNAKANATSTSGDDLNEQIIKQGDLIRELKTKKLSKAEIEPQVKILLDLKSQYKSVTGQSWKPGVTSQVGPEALISLPSNTNNVTDLLNKIAEQGDKVRQFKSQKAEKPVVDEAIKVLLNLKAEFKQLTGNDWKPGVTSPVAPAAPISTKSTSNTNNVTDLLNKIAEQGDKVRQFKSQKAEKPVVDEAIKVLLNLKAEFKQLTGSEWKPCVEPSKIVIKKEKSPEVPAPATIDVLLQKISEQGDKIRTLKAAKANKATIECEVKLLLALKADYKSLTGREWQPGTVAHASNIAATIDLTKDTMEDNEISIPATTEKDLLSLEINAQAEIVRAVKSNSATKEQIDEEVKKLLALKAKYKEVTGRDFPVAGRSGNGNKKSSEKKEPAKTTRHAPKKELVVETSSAGPKKQTRLGLEAKKNENLSDWYSQVITKGELIDYYDVSGCYILRPWSFGIWRRIRDWFDTEITKLGIKEVYFPMFVSRQALEREKTHIADFAPEVAWVTKSGETDLAEPIAVRPTSETVIYPTFAKWVQSYRDLPIRINQWSNVVRWEFKHPQPFLRTREFLWQEGHTAWANKADADLEVLEILDLYAKVYTDLMAIPVVKGHKTKKEKFAGADYTTTVEVFISASGRAIQGATSHHLGQNFSKMFDIVYEDPETQQKKFVFQNSWGITTRTIGVMIMVHSDDQGLVLPPHVATVQAIIVPCGITVNTKDTERTELMDACKKLEKQLLAKGIRCEGDYRDNYSPGWKFNHWELKGVPVRIEMGPKDLKASQIVAVRRDTSEKLILALENVDSKIHQLLETIHDAMYLKAQKELYEQTKHTKNWNDFCNFLDQKNLLLAPFCGEIDCEEKIKADSAREELADAGAPAMGAKGLCIPFEQPAAITTADKCIHPSCTNSPLYYTLFGRSY